LKAAWFQPSLCLKCDLLVSKSCFFKLNLYRYTEEVELLKEKEEREEKEKRLSDKDAADREIAELTAAAEERERDPRWGHCTS
jgi:hypothetical protein